MAKFKVGDKVEDFQRCGTGIISSIYEDATILVAFDNDCSDTYTEEGLYFKGCKTPSLRLTGRPFNISDRVVIGGEKGVVRSNSFEAPNKILVDIGDTSMFVTTDGRAWPGTPIICEHDWGEEGAIIDVNDYNAGSVVNNETENHAADAIEYRERNKGVDISPGFAKDWPVDNGIEDVTVSPEEVRHIAEMQDIAEMQHKKMMEVDALKDQHNYVRMALVLAGIGIGLKAAALVTEIVKKVLELGGEFSLDTACEVEARVNQMYDETNI